MKLTYSTQTINDYTTKLGYTIWKGEVDEIYRVGRVRDYRIIRIDICKKMNIFDISTIKNKDYRDCVIMIFLGILLPYNKEAENTISDILSNLYNNDKKFREHCILLRTFEYFAVEHKISWYNYLIDNFKKIYNMVVENIYELTENNNLYGKIVYTANAYLYIAIGNGLLDNILYERSEYETIC